MNRAEAFLFALMKSENPAAAALAARTYQAVDQHLLQR